VNGVRVRWRLLVVVPLVSTSAAACTVHRDGPGRGAALPATASSSPHPTPTVTILRSVQALAAGQTAQLKAQPGVGLTVRAGRPGVSRSRLSHSYGYAPAHGYYVTFLITIVNTGGTPIDIGPANFRVRIAGEGTVTTTSGNAPYSGASEQLDTTEIDPGQSLSGPLTFDVRRPHGVLSYVPDRTAAVTWRF
jgi:hypothetical protein